MNKYAYVAGRTNDIDRVREVQDICKSFEYFISFDWTRAEGNFVEWKNYPERAAKISENEITASRNCHVFVLVCGDAGGIGSWIELGVALGSELAPQIIIIGQPEKDSIFFWHHRVINVSLNEFNQLMMKLNRN